MEIIPYATCCVACKEKNEDKKRRQSVETTSYTVKNSSGLFYYVADFSFGSVNQNLVRVNMQMYECIPLLQNLFGDTFILIRVQNSGAEVFSFGFGSDLVNRIIFICVTVLVVGIIIYLLHYAQHKIQVIAFGLILGGALEI